MCVFHSYTVVTVDSGLVVAEEKGGRIISPVLQNPVIPIGPFIVRFEFVFECL